MTAFEYPSELTADEAISFFLRLARQLLSQRVPTRDVLHEFIRFYRECRVIGAPVEDGYDADTFCIECGNYSKITAVDIDDFRGKGDIGYQSGPKELSMSIRRTVHAINALPEYSEFDDDAFEMNVSLYYGPTDDDASYFLEVGTLEQLDAEIAKASRDKLISRLLIQTPNEASAHVGGAG